MPKYTRPELLAMTKPQLVEIARALSVAKAGMSKAHLVDSIVGSQMASARATVKAKHLDGIIRKM